MAFLTYTREVEKRMQARPLPRRPLLQALFAAPRRPLSRGRAEKRGDSPDRRHFQT
jgi:hypothetical protein